MADQVPHRDVARVEFEYRRIRTAHSHRTTDLCHEIRPNALAPMLRGDTHRYLDELTVMSRPEALPGAECCSDHVAGLIDCRKADRLLQVEIVTMLSDRLHSQL